MTLPDPEVRARPSVVGRGVPPRVPRGEDRPRVVVVSSSPPASPPAFASTRAARFISRRPGPLRLRLPSGGGRRPSLPPGPLARCVVSRPAGSRSPDPARSGSGFVPLSPALRLAAARVGGPAAAPHPLSSARPRPPAWNRGVVSRRGASRGSASVSRRLGGSRRVASPGSGHPPPSSRSSSPARPSASRRAPLAPRGGCAGGLRGSPSLFRRASAVRGSRLSPRPRGVFRPPRAPLARSLPRVSASLGSSSRSYLVDPASSICLSQRLSHACLSTHGRYSETANGSLNQLWFLWSLAPLLLG